MLLTSIPTNFLANLLVPKFVQSKLIVPKPVKLTNVLLCFTFYTIPLLNNT